jgi:pimeloyl-ACP methyl ester carboxylesterase
MLEWATNGSPNKSGRGMLNTTVITAEDPRACILFLSGGGLKVGRERYNEWQDRFARVGISSVSFDYSGVNGSGLPLEKSSLGSRIEEAACVVDWMKEHVKVDRYLLYGTSMGGYIALGLTNERQGLFDALVLHAPAAYSSQAHYLHFGQGFTDEIRKETSWTDSPSFTWLDSYKKPVLFIEAEKEKIIPKPITEKYKTLKKNGMRVLFLKNTAHDIWGQSAAEKEAQNTIYDELLHFIG